MTDPHPIPGFTFAVTCPECGGPVHQITNGTTNGRQTQAIIACTTCRRVELVTVTLTTVKTSNHQMPSARRTFALCGTESGYGRHRRNGEPACAACKAAHSAAVSRRRRAV